MPINDFLFNLINGNNFDYIELFGYKFYFDDLLIISILFCLYIEGINDQWLFISLLLLLFS